MLRRVPVARLMAFLLVFSMMAVQGTVAVGAADKAAASWTFMVYLDGDNNLESCGVDDFMEMSSVGSNAQVTIVVQFDRGTHSDSNGGSSDYGNWASTKRFQVTSGQTPTAAHQISDLGEANMGSAATLQSFLEWGMNGYPASRYALVLWDHGGGWVYGVCSDDTDSGDSLLMPEIRQAISSAETSTGKRVDLVGFDACLMGMVEVAYDLRTYSDTVVFSEETEPGQGWAYDKVLTSLRGSPTMSSQQLGTVIVDAYSDYYGSSGKETLSSVATSSLASVSSALNTFSNEMSSAYAVHSGQINAARGAVERFEYEMIVDLYDLALRVKNAGITTALGNAADQLMSSIQTSVTREAHGNLRSGAHGLSIYYPDVRSDLNLVGYRSDVLLAQDTSWDEFLETSFQGTSSDQYEPDDVYSQASQLVMGEPQYHSILDGGADVDWAKFSVPSSTDVVIETSGVSGDTELYLFNEAGVPSAHIAYDDDGGIDTFSRISRTLSSGTYYILVREYGQNREIGSYQLTVSMPLQGDIYEPDDDYAHASFILLGESQLHSIGGGGADEDWVGLDLMTTQSVRIETSGESGDTRIWLYEDVGSQLTMLDSDDDSGTELFSRLVMTDLAAGMYYIQVDEYYNDEEIPAYHLSVNALSMDDAYEEDDSYDLSNDLVPGMAQVHSIGSADDPDWFHFSLYSDSDVSIETSGSEGDTVMYLFAANEVPDYYLESDDDSGDGYFSLLEMSSLQQGQYYVEIEAYQGTSGSDPIPEYSIVVLTDPSAPYDLTYISNQSFVGLGWSVPLSDGGSPIDHYQILRSMVGGEPSAFREALGTSFVDYNVSAGESYVYAVRAVTNFGSGAASDIVQINVTAIWGAPEAVGVCSVDQADDHISLTWTAPYAHDNPIIVYHVYRGISSDGSDRVEIGQPTSPSYVDYDVAKGQTYYYWVVAENGFGMGSMSVLTEATAVANGGLGDLSWLPLVAALAFIIIVAVIVLVLMKGAKTRSHASKTLPMTHPAFQPQVNQGRCPSCGASVEGMQYCGNCGRRVP